MDDPIEFIRHQPWWVLIAVLYFIISLLGGRKKKAQQAAQQLAKARQQTQPQSQTQPQTRPVRAQAQQQPQQQFRSKLEEALRNAMQEADREFSQSGSPAGASSKEKPAPPKVVPATTAQPSQDDAFAFHSLLNAPEKERVDYDKAATDYDKKGNAFAFREAVSEPVDKEFHLSGFQGFHVAHGLSATERGRAAGEDAYAESDGGFSFSIGNADDLRRAIIIREVFGKPKALRRE
jgi:hypothetical protein